MTGDQPRCPANALRVTDSISRVKQNIPPASATHIQGSEDAPLISVIVPVYNVERYLRQGIDSILGQTHRSLEILLVDDGSPDGCPAICDDYARQDARVRVIHQANQGLSAARNSGLDAATGDFIAFVDSDDWIESDMLASLLNGLRKHDADIAGCLPIPEIEDGITVHFPLESPDSPVRLDRVSALQELLRDRRLRNFSWSYLYRAKVFDGVRFPNGKRFEDIHTTYRTFMRAHHVVAMPFAKYHYRIRKGSITQAGGLGGLIDQYEALKARQEVLAAHFPQFADELLAQRFTLVPAAWRAASVCDAATRSIHQPALADMARFTADHRHHIVAAKGYGKAERLLVWLCAHATPWSYAAAAKLQDVLAARSRRPQ